MLSPSLSSANFLLLLFLLHVSLPDYQRDHVVSLFIRAAFTSVGHGDILRFKDVAVGVEVYAGEVSFPVGTKRFIIKLKESTTQNGPLSTGIVVVPREVHPIEFVDTIAYTCAASTTKGGCSTNAAGLFIKTVCPPCLPNANTDHMANEGKKIRCSKVCDGDSKGECKPTAFWYLSNCPRSENTRRSKCFAIGDDDDKKAATQMLELTAGACVSSRALRCARAALRTYANLPKAIPFSYHLPPLSRPHAPAVNRREWGNNKNVDHDVSYVKVCDRCSVIKWYACNLNCPTSTSYVWVHAKRWGEIVGAAKDHLNNLLNNDIKTFRKLFGAPRTAVLQEMLPQCAECARWLTSKCVQAAMKEFTFSDVDAETVLEALAGISTRACENVKVSACSAMAKKRKNFYSFK